MADSPAKVATPTSAQPKMKTPGKKDKTSKTSKPSHPTTALMVSSAISALKEKRGSSLHAIKKYVSANYNVDSEKLAPFIRKYIKAAVVAGSLTQTKGAGATGSFKLNVPGESKSKSTSRVVKKKSKSSIVKTTTKESPSVNKKKPAVAKAKKTKTPPTKPKVPKVKKTSGTATITKSPKKLANTSVASKRKPLTKRLTSKAK